MYSNVKQVLAGLAIEKTSDLWFPDVSGLLSFPVILYLCNKNAFSVGKYIAIKLAKVFGIFMYSWTHQLRIISCYES